MPRRGRPATALIVAGLASAAVLLLLLARSPTAAERAAAGSALAAGIQARVTLTGSSLRAGRAIADFGVGAEVRLVRVPPTTPASATAAGAMSSSVGCSRRRCPRTAIDTALRRACP